MTDLPPDTLAAMSAFLLDRLEALRHHELAPTLHDEITRAVGRCVTAVDTPPRPNLAKSRPFPCPTTLEDGTDCPGKVYAYLPSDETEGAWMECDTCLGDDGTPRNWPSSEWARASKRIVERMAG
jgi:hypothetical protein